MLNIAPMILLGSLATWVFHPLIVIALTFDGIVYSLVSYSYNLFLIMSKLNFDIIYGWFTPIIDRIKAVILVFIMFKVGISLVQYMLEPEKFNDKNVGGAALIKNIGIVAILLILYPFVFSALNELSALIIGIPDYNYSTLSTIADITGGEETGLITRFIFGAEADVENFGKELSIGTLEIFLHSAGEGNSKIESIYGKMQSTDKNFDMMEIVTVATEVGRSIDYKWPLISTAAGLYIVYSLVTISIEIGIRMLKLVIMQILAPVIIVSMVGKGFAEPNWNRFCKQYISIYLSAFFRIATMYITIGFISKFFNDASVLFKISESQNDGVTPFIIKILMMVAAFKFSKELPKFIDGILGTHIENPKHGFGSFVRGTLGAAFGSVVGLGTGLAAGAATGLTGGALLANGLSGMVNGGVTGSKGKSVADYFKMPGNMATAGINRAQGIQKNGVGGSIGRGAANFFGVAPIHDARINSNLDQNNKTFEREMEALNNSFEAANQSRDERIQQLNDSNTSLDGIERNIMNNMEHDNSTFTYGDGSSIEFGRSSEDFAKLVAENDSEYMNAQRDVMKLEAKLNGGRGDNYAVANQIKQAKIKADTAYREAQKKAREAYQNRMDSDVAAQGTTSRSRQTTRENNSNEITRLQREGAEQSRTHNAEVKARQKAHDDSVKALNKQKYGK